MPPASPSTLIELPYSQLPVPPRVPRPRFLAAFFLALPGMICWASLGLILLAWHVPASRTWLRPLDPIKSAVVLIWLLAILTAMISISIYWRAPKRWFVLLNLMVNIAGLLMTGLIVVAIIYLFVGFEMHSEDW